MYNLGLCFFSLFDSKDIFNRWIPFYLLDLLRSHWWFLWFIGWFIGYCGLWWIILSRFICMFNSRRIVLLLPHAMCDGGGGGDGFCLFCFIFCYRRHRCIYFIILSLFCLLALDCVHFFTNIKQSIGYLCLSVLFHCKYSFLWKQLFWAFAVAFYFIFISKSCCGCEKLSSHHILLTQLDDFFHQRRKWNWIEAKNQLMINFSILNILSLDFVYRWYGIPIVLYTMLSFIILHMGMVFIVEELRYFRSICLLCCYE